MEYAQHLADDSARFAAVLRGCTRDAPVPSCPDWTALDLAWHLSEVHRVFGRIVAGRLLARPTDGVPAQPDGLGSTLDLLEDHTAALCAALADTPDDVRVWTWADDDSIGWVRRRMAHEALVHRIDAELTAGVPPVVDAGLATDGIDELLASYLTGVPPWGTFAADGVHVAIRVEPSGREWGLALGRMTGTSPRSGRRHDLPAAMPAPAALADTTVRGDAVAVHAWLWGRGDDRALIVEGDPERAVALRVLAADATG